MTSLLSKEIGLKWGVDMAKHVKESKVEFHATFGSSSHDF
jgi:hypothetical protein